MAAADASPDTVPTRSERRHWEALSIAAARDLPPGRIGGVIAQLRQRGCVANGRAGLFLLSVITTVFVGLGYYILLPLLEAYADGTARTWQALVDAGEVDNAALDTRRTEAVGALKDALALAPERVRAGEGERLDPPLALDGGGLVATGWNGTILRSADGGATWDKVRAGEGERLYPPLALDGGGLVATGWNGTILRSADGGATWDKVRAGEGERLYPPLALDGGGLVATGWNGTILRSADGGATWDKVREREGEGLYTPLALDGGGLVAAGWNGTILRSADGGATWDKVREREGEGLYTPLALDGGGLVAAGWNGTILRSADGGATWDKVRPRWDANWLRQESFNPLSLTDRALILAGQSGTILRSADGGVTWLEVRARESEGSEGFNTPVAAADGTLIATGGGGTILRSTDYGASWSEARPFIDEILFPASIGSDGTIIVTGEDGTILLSHDGATNWIEVLARSDGAEGFNAVALADRTIIAMGHKGTILRLSGDTAARLGALAADLPPGGTGDAALAAFRDGLDPAVRAAGSVAATILALDRIAVERGPVEAGLARARERLAARESGAAAAEVQRAAFATFMEGCRMGATNPEDAALTKACLDAFVASETESRRDWWESLAEQVPPGILLLFLLATLSGLYRYNVRLAGFHNGRADALELMVAGVDKDLLTPIADALAADKVEFGAAKTPTDHAAEMATAFINRVKP